MIKYIDVLLALFPCIGLLRKLKASAPIIWRKSFLFLEEENMTFNLSAACNCLCTAPLEIFFIPNVMEL
ncbi:MAG: hypothetical protein CME91_05045 [Hyphomonadaceae bacterium]|nr:hypothetical protein [Hyphomonadaceae bacterium]